MNWHLQDAKNNFSKLVKRAQEEGPQTVTLRGRRAAVVLSAEEYDKLAGNKKTIVDYILASPEWPDEMHEEVNHRSKSPFRDVDL